MAQRGHTIIVEVEQGEIRCGLILKDPLLRRDVFVQRRITILVINRDIEQGGDPGMEPVDRFKLKTRDLHNEVVVRSRLPCLAGTKVLQRRVAQGSAQIAADKRPLAAFAKNLADK